MSWPSKIDFEAARQRRAAVKAAGGVLDLVLPLRLGGTGQPLFCAHPVIGLSWCYTALLAHIDVAHAIYGLQSRGLRRPEPLPASMRELARDFADQIHSTQPAGPYHLLGWSLGGIVAYAIAEELERRGEEVGLLALLDAYPHDPVLDTEEHLWIQFNIVLADFGYPQVLARGDDLLEERVLEIVRSRPKGALYGWSDEQIHTLMRVTRNNVALARDYRPGPLHSGLLFFSAVLTQSTVPRTIERWRPFVDQPIDVVELASRHEHMMAPGTLAQVGAVVTSRLAATRAQALPDVVLPDAATPAAAR